MAFFPLVSMSKLWPVKMLRLVTLEIH